MIKWLKKKFTKTVYLKPSEYGFPIHPGHMMTLSVDVEIHDNLLIIQNNGPKTLYLCQGELPLKFNGIKKQVKND